MKITESTIQILRKAAEKSPSRYRIGGIAFSKRGNILGARSNTFRMDNIEPKRGAGGHCEQRLMREFGRKVKTIIIMRIGKNGEIAPIDPCETCSKIANKMGVKIITVSPEDV